MTEYKKIVATIEARMNSTRLPGKVLKDIGGMTSLECQIRRLRNSVFIDEIVLATTKNKTDDALEAFGIENEIRVYRGSEEDILSRILGASISANGDLQVQITGDCPFIDPEIIDEILGLFIKGTHYDFISNEIERSYPIGLDCRVFPVSLLTKVDELCKDPIHRSHGTTYIYLGEGKKIFKYKNISAPKALHNPTWRWTLDTEEDLLFIREVAKHFRDRVISFSTEELTSFLRKNPEILKINSEIKQKNWQDG